MKTKLINLKQQLADVLENGAVKKGSRPTGRMRNFNSTHRGKVNLTSMQI